MAPRVGYFGRLNIDTYLKINYSSTTSGKNSELVEEWLSVVDEVRTSIKSTPEPIYIPDLVKQRVLQKG